ncbi:MAG: prepilin-type N-terminal cleavage/methylation domain-containing protein [Firmicutes bacterium]|nr:prepilin-type N-terminal cleavage/methylation domain-containing protein [Bacillota bacterium]
MKTGKLMKKLNNSKAFTLSELLAVVLILSLIMTTLAGGLTVVRTAYEKITLKAESATLMSTVITKVTDELRFASDVEVNGDGVVTFESGIRGYRISIENITDSEGKTQNIGIKTNQGDSPIVQPLVSEKILSEGVVPEISLSYNTDKGLFDVTVTVKKGDTTVVNQKFYVTPVNN